MAKMLRRAGEQAEALTERLENMAAQLDTLFHEMDFRFLYDSKCHLFSLGYRVTEGALDPSYYDLLASEARLSSFVAIAKRDVPSTALVPPWPKGDTRRAWHRAAVVVGIDVRIPDAFPGDVYPALQPARSDLPSGSEATDRIW